MRLKVNCHKWVEELDGELANLKARAATEEDTG